MVRDCLVFCVKKHWLFVVLSFSSIFFSALTSIFAGKVVGYFVSRLYLSSELIKLFLISTCIVFLLSVTAFLRIFSTGVFGAIFISELQKRLYSKMTLAKVGDINLYFNSIISAFSVDISNLKGFFGGQLAVFARNILALAGSIMMLVYSNVSLFTSALIGISVILLFILPFGRYVKNISQFCNSFEEKLQSLISGDLGNIKMIKAFLSERVFIDIFSAKSTELYRYFCKHQFLRSLFISVGIFITFSSIFIVVFFGIKAVLSNEIDSATFAEFIFYSMLAASSANAIMEIQGNLQQVRQSVKNIDEVFNQLKPESKSIATPSKINSFDQITFENVSFSHEASSPTLCNLSFVINSGEYIAIVGPSGAGKSTIISLLLRFYDPSKGRILIDGKDFCKMHTKSARSLFAWVSQDADLIDGTIAENITMRNAKFSQQEFENACKMSGIWELILGLPDGQNTIISKKIRQLSRGQRQRILIARAVFCGAPIIIFDEATASLDAKSEAIVQDSISKIKGKKTVIVVAHRFSAIRSADKIMVLKNGVIDIVGSHKDLMLKSQYYQEMIKLQSKD